MRKGFVIRCHLHKIAIRRNQKKYEWYNSPNDTSPAIVQLTNLAETLNPFGEPIKKSTDKLMGQVPKDYPNINADASLKDFDYFWRQIVVLDVFRGTIKNTIKLGTY